MLTEEDLKSIRKIIREEVENEVSAAKDELQADINHSQLRIRGEIDELKDRIKNLEIRVTKMHAELKEEMKTIANILDKDNMKTLKRVQEIEEHIGLAA
jgi:chromosome segregation ATPase